MRLDDVLRPKDEGKNDGQGEASQDALPQADTGFDAGSDAGGKAKRTVAGAASNSGRAARPAALRAAVATPSAPDRENRGAPFSAVGWHSTTASIPKQPLWEAMPTFNRVLAVFGGACLVLALGRVVVPPVAESARQAYRPYTTAGKQEICLTHLGSIAQALAAYSKDNDGRFPPLDYQSTQGKRFTWVSLISGQVAEDGLTCPVGPKLPDRTEHLTSSYKLNPVAAVTKTSEMDDPSSALLLADGGTKHDVSLLPPYPSWPSFAARRADGGLDAATCNLDFRHNGQAAGGALAGVAYVDGHAGTLASGSWVTDAAAWGGSAVLRRSRDRLASSSAEAGELFKRLQNDDLAGAASYVAAHRAALKAASGDMAALWRLNTGAHTSDSVEGLGWNLARAWKQVGDATFEAQLNTEETHRSQFAAQQMNGVPWQSHQVEGQPSLRAQAPSLWEAQPSSEGRYCRLLLRSPLPAVSVLLEVGRRIQYVTPQPIDWRGAEKDLQDRYGSAGYRRLNLGATTLGSQAASAWDYEVEKVGNPRLRKHYVGYTDGWNSYVLACTAPAQDWKLWQPIFDQLIKSAQSGDLPAE